MKFLRLSWLRSLASSVLLLSALSLQAQAADTGADNAFSPRRGATDLVVKTVNEATQSVCVAAYSFTSDPIADALLAAKARGVAVRVTLDKSQARGKSSILPRLQQAGLPVRIDRRYAIMHDKFMVIDDKVLQLGSFNYTNNAERNNAENVLVIRRYKKVIASYAAECDRLWDESVEPLPDGTLPPATKKPPTAKRQQKAKPAGRPYPSVPPIISFP